MSDQSVHQPTAQSLTKGQHKLSFRHECRRCKLKYRYKHTCTRKSSQKSSDRLLKELDDDALHLLKLVAYLGGSIPRRFLDRLKADKLIWGSDGNVSCEKSLAIAVVADESRCRQAIHVLQDKRIVQHSETDLSLAPGMQDRILSATPDPEKWQSMALMAVLHVFPEHRQLEPTNYSAIILGFISQFQHVLPHLRKHRISRELTYPQTLQAINVSLSASYFLNVEWKKSILDAAQEMLQPHDSSFADFDPNLARLNLRRMALARISQEVDPQTQLLEIRATTCRFLATNKRTNAYLGEMYLFEARLLVDLQRFEEARLALNQFVPRDPHDVSELERIQQHDIAFLQGEIARYEGKFGDAHACFLKLLDWIPSPPKLTTQHSAVACELGMFGFAASTLLEDLNAARAPNSFTGGRNVSRLQLALAEVYTTEAANLAAQGLQNNCDGGLPTQVVRLTEKARALLDHLWQKFRDKRDLKKVGLINRFRVMVAFAMVEHLTGDPSRAIELWDQTQTFSREMWPEGYSDAIIKYSKSDLMYRQKNYTEARSLEDKAILLCRHTGRRFHIAGLGTVWPAYVGASLTICFRRRLLPW